MLGIECNWECPECGVIIRTNSPFWDEKLRKKIAEPVKCQCGYKGKFKLNSFSECKFEVIKSGYKLVDEKGDEVTQ